MFNSPVIINKNQFVQPQVNLQQPDSMYFWYSLTRLQKLPGTSNKRSLASPRFLCLLFLGVCMYRSSEMYVFNDHFHFTSAILRVKTFLFHEHSVSPKPHALIPHVEPARARSSISSSLALSSGLVDISNL